MRMHKIKAMVYRDFLIMFRIKARVAESFYFPVTTIIIWGLFSTFVRDYAAEAGFVVLAMNVFWNFAYLAQSNTNIQIMEDSWSGSIRQILVSGITELEYLVSRLISSTIVSLIVMALMLAMSYYIFGLSVIASKFAIIIAFMLLTLMSSIALAGIIGAFMIMLGKEYGFLAWTSMQLFVVFSAPFYPVSIMPPLLQAVAQAMPFTKIFEGMRMLISSGSVSSDIMLHGLAVSLIYFVASFPLFVLAFRRARKTGRLARMS